MGSRLTTLLLRGNKLSNLPPESFKYFTKLEKLDLSDNFHVIPFKSAAYFPKSLENLKDLSLQNCNISSLSDNIFVNLRNLEKLNLYENPLTSIPKAINILPNLLQLYIGQTNISTLRHSEDVKNDNLQNIYLSFSENLTTVESCAFCNFPKLQSIDFESCKNLKSIHENAFGSISLQKPLNIKDFYIGGCNISTLPEKLLDWKNLKNLYIRDNVFSCDCKMAWLAKDLMENKEKWNNVLEYYFESVNNITCSFQNQMEKIPLINLNLSICK